MGDDVVQTVVLGAPFTFYGTTYTSLSMSSNGFLSTNTTSETSDFSNDCPLPAPVGADRGRIYALHDDLVLQSGTGEGYYEYFPVSPITGHDPGAISQPLSVFMWDNVRHFGDGITWDMEVLLFHTTGEIFVQIGAGNPELGSGSTTGIQNPDGSIGLAYACDTAASIPDDTAVVFLPPNIIAGTVIRSVPPGRSRA